MKPVKLDASSFQRIAQGMNKISQEGGYQGFTNYETWAVALWLDQDQGMYEMIREAAPTMEGYELGEYIKDMLEEDMPELGNTMWADLLNGALEAVNWQEVGENAKAE